jgi:hypothetical protein
LSAAIFEKVNECHGREIDLSKKQKPVPDRPVSLLAPLHPSDQIQVGVHCLVYHNTNNVNGDSTSNMIYGHSPYVNNLLFKLSHYADTSPEDRGSAEFQAANKKLAGTLFHQVSAS